MLLLRTIINPFGIVLNNSKNNTNYGLTPFYISSLVPSANADFSSYKNI